MVRDGCTGVGKLPIVPLVHPLLLMALFNLLFISYGLLFLRVIYASWSV